MIASPGPARARGLYGPELTFPCVPAADLEVSATWAGADVVIVGAPYDGGTSSRPGTRFGPGAIRSAPVLPHAAFAGLRVVDAGDVEMRAPEPESALTALEEVVRRIAASGAVPVVLGGDHSIAWADVRGVASAMPGRRLSLLHLDAHADTGGRQVSRYGHGSQMRRLVECGVVRGTSVVQLGLRGYWPPAETLEWMAGRGIRSYEMAELVSRGLDDCMGEMLSLLRADADAVFVSVDIDVVDPGLAPGTGTPEPGGLTGWQLLDVVRRAARELPVVGMELVEVSPPFDHVHITAALANRVVVETIAGVARRRLGRERDA